MQTTLLDDALNLAVDVAQRAADMVRARGMPSSVSRKADGSLLTETDEDIERMISDVIHRRFPDHGFLGEESVDDVGRSSGESEYWWVVDPLDGTRNFAHGFPATSTSIALMRAETPVVAVVHEHGSGWYCSAVSGRGARCNGSPASVVKTTPDRDVLIAIPSSRRRPVLPVVKRWMDRYVVRNVGSTALHLAYVACGAVDAALCYDAKIWDIAAGALLVTEAGGRCTNFRGDPVPARPPFEYAGDDVPTFAAAPGIHRDLLDDLSAVRS